MQDLFKTLWRDDPGHDTTEYVLIVLLVALAVTTVEYVLLILLIALATTAAIMTFADALGASDQDAADRVPSKGGRSQSA